MTDKEEKEFIKKLKKNRRKEDKIIHRILNWWKKEKDKYEKRNSN